MLLVEGINDLHVVNHLLSRHDLEQPFSIKDKCGFEKLRASIHNEVNAPGRGVLGILADANDDIDGRWWCFPQFCDPQGP